MSDGSLTISGYNGGEARLEEVLAIIAQETPNYDRFGDGLGITEAYRLINQSDLPEDVQSIVGGMLIDYKHYARNAGVQSDEVPFDPEIFSRYAHNIEDGGVAFFSEVFPAFAQDTQMTSSVLDNSGIDARLTDDDIYLASVLESSLNASSGWVVENGDVKTPIWEALNRTGTLDEAVTISTQTLQDIRLEQLDKQLEMEDKQPNAINAQKDTGAPDKHMR